MMKKTQFLPVLILLIMSTLLYAQKDTEHWFAPMAARTNVLNLPQQALYFSTDSVTPFSVEIFSNNILLGTVTISKGNPATFDIPISNMITDIDSEKFVPVGKGLYTKGSKPYFVNFRFSVIFHGEILTSKGKAGIGKKYYTVVAPNTLPDNLNNEYTNFTTGILATEDNTTVNVSGYDPDVQFSNGTNGTTNPTLTFTLNKGQAYIIEGKGKEGKNQTGFIGSKIESDKPISVTNGNFGGQFAIGNNLEIADIIMDQSVPTERLGKEFALIKGNGTVQSAEEDALIVATEDHTEIYVNGLPTPVATLNEGDWYRVNIAQNGTYASQYIDQGNNHFNMHIRATKNVYVYQLLASHPTNRYAQGFNYIPPLNCFLPRKIDEIGMVNILPPTTNDVKLNILTEAGATVMVNGAALPSAQGPYSIAGTNAWVSYSVPSVTGNISITSTKAVTAGICGGSGAVGYGGYFAGFSSIPVITKKTGDCAPGIILEVDDSYEAYQWYLNGNPVSGATSSTFSPLQGGDYTVKVTIGTCAPLFTPVYQVLSCIKQTTQSATVCSSTKIITPTFSSSTQIPVPSTVTITTAPANGTAAVNTNGTITYTPNPAYTGPDQIVYKFCGNGSVGVDCEQITLNLTVVSLKVQDAQMKLCQYDQEPYAYFDLTTANITSQPSAIKKYFRTIADLNGEINEIATPDHFPSTGGFVYVKVITQEGCTANARIELIANLIKKSPALTDQYICADSRVNLDAGPGYDSYLWNTGATTPSIQDVGIGEYSVVLSKNGCSLTQVVRVKKAEDPVISRIEISNNSATVIANGGKPPYRYSVDGFSNWQESNLFTGLTRGQHIFYVKDAYDCEPVSVEITIPNLINAITPNGDHKNDFIDYSALAYKENLSFAVYDRYGNRIFTGDKFSNYQWDGRHSNKKLITGTYWYHISWTEPDKGKTQIQYTGWILVKNVE